MLAVGGCWLVLYLPRVWIELVSWVVVCSDRGANVCERARNAKMHVRAEATVGHKK